MKLTKEDYMRLPKERLAELLAEMDSVEIPPITIPTPPSIPDNDPWKQYPYWPIITYAEKASEANTAVAHPDSTLKAE